MLNKIREIIVPIIDRIGSTFAKTGISPTGWSVIGLLLAALSGIAYSGLWGDWVLGGVLLLVSGFFDIVDGSVARVTQTISHRGAFLDSNFDRIAEILVYGGLISGAVGEPLVVFTALASSIMVSYARVKSESLNVNVSGIGIGERAERILILAVLSIMGFPYYGVIIVIAIASLTFIQRFIYTIKKLGK